MESNMETTMSDSGLWKSLGIQVYKQFLHWALKSVNISYSGLFGALGNFI